MMSLEQTRELWGKEGESFTDAEMEDIRVLSWMLAGVAYDVWLKREQEQNK